MFSPSKWLSASKFCEKKYVGGEKMARNGGKMAKRKICVLFKFPDFMYINHRNDTLKMIKH